MKNIRLKDVLFILVGVIIGVIIMGILWPKRIAKLQSGEEVVASTTIFKVTANDIYEELKKSSGVNALVNIVDKRILEEKYVLTEEDLKDIQDNANYYFDMYEQNYGISKEEFLKKNGFSSEDEFLDYLKLDFLRKKYYDESLVNKISEEEIKEYYEKNVFAPFNVEHILVKITDDVTDAKAKSKATEILNKLKKGTSFDELKTIYKEDIINESFKVEFTSNLEESFMNAAKKLKDNTYSKELVKTSYGYHIIYRKDSLEMPTLDNTKEIIINIIKETLQDEEDNSYVNILINMRNEKKFKISDTELNKDYENKINNLDE